MGLGSRLGLRLGLGFGFGFGFGFRLEEEEEDHLEHGAQDARRRAELGDHREVPGLDGEERAAHQLLRAHEPAPLHLLLLLPPGVPWYPVAGAQYVGPSGQAALRLRYVHNAR